MSQTTQVKKMANNKLSFFFCPKLHQSTMVQSSWTLQIPRGATYVHKIWPSSRPMASINLLVVAIFKVFSSCTQIFVRKNIYYKNARYILIYDANLKSTTAKCGSMHQRVLFRQANCKFKCKFKLAAEAKRQLWRRETTYMIGRIRYDRPVTGIFFFPSIYSSQSSFILFFLTLLFLTNFVIQNL